jgi:hypothetical protein
VAYHVLASRTERFDSKAIWYALRQDIGRGEFYVLGAQRRDFIVRFLVLPQKARPVHVSCGDMRVDGFVSLLPTFTKVSTPACAIFEMHSHGKPSAHCPQAHQHICKYTVGSLHRTSC